MSQNSKWVSRPYNGINTLTEEKAKPITSFSLSADKCKTPSYEQTTTKKYIMYLVIPKSEIFTIFVELTKQFLAAYERRKEQKFEYNFFQEYLLSFSLVYLGSHTTSLYG